mmetsp:Transcript_20399/g.34809  ORF Transcript_20399/g.34809 Transcript_20399/m.34809 type:complete len:96 (-) Transcript_20399:107-394(-)
MKHIGTIVRGAGFVCHLPVFDDNPMMHTDEGPTFRRTRGGIMLEYHCRGFMVRALVVDVWSGMVLAMVTMVLNKIDEGIPHSHSDQRLCFQLSLR